MPHICWNIWAHMARRVRFKTRSFPFLVSSLREPRTSDRESWIAAISFSTRSECSSWSSNAASACRASSRRPFRASHRGDSGININNGSTNRAKMTGNTSGTRQLADPVVAKKNPKETHSERVMPALMAKPSMMTKEPRCADAEHSVCHTGTEADTVPIDAPTMSRPMMNCARE